MLCVHTCSRVSVCMQVCVRVSMFTGVCACVCVLGAHVSGCGGALRRSLLTGGGGQDSEGQPLGGAERLKPGSGLWWGRC